MNRYDTCITHITTRRMVEKVNIIKITVLYIGLSFFFWGGFLYCMIVCNIIVYSMHIYIYIHIVSYCVCAPNYIYTYIHILLHCMCARVICPSCMIAQQGFEMVVMRQLVIFHLGCTLRNLTSAKSSVVCSLNHQTSRPC